VWAMCWQIDCRVSRLDQPRDLCIVDPGRRGQSTAALGSKGPARTRSQAGMRDPPCRDTVDNAPGSPDTARSERPTEAPFCGRFFAPVYRSSGT